MAVEILGGNKGDYSIVHPNDDVNMGQSTNDVVPTAGKMTTIRLLVNLRVQMQDAVPISLGQEFQAYSDSVMRNIGRLDAAIEEMRTVNMGGTAIGTGINADEEYISKIIPALNSVSKMDLRHAGDLIDSTQNLDPFVTVSGIVKACAVTLSKIANDLRLMSSGPRTGFGEITLPARQNGSSIMPGKVNPVIPEVVNQVAFNVVGNDMTIALAADNDMLDRDVYYSRSH